MKDKSNHKTETKIGKTTYIVRSIFDQNADEDLANKLYNKFRQDDNAYRLGLIYLPSKDSETHD